MRRLLASLPPILIALVMTAHGQAIHVGRNFVVEASSEVLARKAAEQAEDTRSRFASTWLGREIADWTVKVPIIVRYGETPGGREWQPGSLFCLVEAWGPDGEAALGVLAHEVAHAVVDREVERRQSVPRWMHEGIAVDFERTIGRKPNRYGKIVGRMPLAAFLATPGIAYGDGDAFYLQGASVVHLIRERWGNDALWDFYRKGTSAGWELACVAVLGLTIDDLNRAYLDSLGQPDSPYP